MSYLNFHELKSRIILKTYFESDKISKRTLVASVRVSGETPTRSTLIAASLMMVHWCEVYWYTETQS